VAHPSPDGRALRDPPANVTLHLKAIYVERELDEAATRKDYLRVRSEGTREVSRALRHYRLEAILAVGCRVRSARGTPVPPVVHRPLTEFLVKGFTMDDERLKNPHSGGKGGEAVGEADALKALNAELAQLPARLRRDKASDSVTPSQCAIYGIQRLILHQKPPLLTRPAYTL
jgi:hypothetical protein